MAERYSAGRGGLKALRGAPGIGTSSARRLNTQFDRKLQLSRRAGSPGLRPYPSLWRDCDVLA
jgi:hypothetical protein